LKRSKSHTKKEKEKDKSTKKQNDVEVTKEQESIDSSSEESSEPNNVSEESESAHEVSNRPSYGKLYFHMLSLFNKKPQIPTEMPSSQPSSSPSSFPSATPSFRPSAFPVASPSVPPTISPAPSKTQTKFPSHSPTTSLSTFPSSFPSTSPTMKCPLELKLAHVHGLDVTKQEYYGVHADLMYVTKDGDDDIYSCSGENAVYYPEKQANWCKYDSTYLSEDYYGAATYYMDGDFGWDPFASDERIVIDNAANSSFSIRVYHRFAPGGDYYYSDKEYGGQYYGSKFNDHMMAARLNVKNLSDGSKIESVDGINYDDGWYHPVDIHTSTHSKESPDGTNYDYKDAFEVIVSCDESCSCAGSYRLL